MIRKLMSLLMLTICHTVFAQGMDSSYCLIDADESLKKTGGNPINTCDPKIIQNMITEKNTFIMLRRFTNQGEYVHTVIWGHDYFTQHIKIKPSFIGTIRVSSRAYQREKNLIYDTDKFGCTVITRMTEDTATYLSLKAEALKGKCDHMREPPAWNKDEVPSRYRKIKY
jgi:hypothetical protein